MTSAIFRTERLALAGVLLALATACIQRRPLSATEQWIGHNEQELIESWGKPDQTILQPDGTHVSTWIYRHSEFPPGQAPVDRVCRRTFKIASSGKLLKWSIEGGCAAH